jgi:hypothetical protein
MSAPATPVMSAPEVSAYIDEVFPQIKANGDDISVEAVSPGTALVRLHADDKHLRPGGTVSGPTLFMLSDLAAYAVILAHIGRVGAGSHHQSQHQLPEEAPARAAFSIRDSEPARRTYSIPPQNCGKEVGADRRRRSRRRPPGGHHRHPSARQAQADLHPAHVDMGDNVIVINADKVVLTGNKRTHKTITGTPAIRAASRKRTADKILEGRFPERVLEKPSSA